LFESVLGEDVGQQMASVAMKGAPSTFAFADVSGRLELGNLFGIDSYAGFSLKNIVGPTGAVFENLYKGAQLASRGEALRATEQIMPVPFKKMIRLIRDGGKVRDQAGRLLFQPTGIEQLGLALGFQPRRLAETREAQRLIRKTEEVDIAQTQRFHRGLVDQLLTGDIPQVQQALLDREQSGIGYSAQAGARRLSELAVDRQLPYDLSRQGRKSTAGERSRLSRIQSDISLPTEVERLLLKGEISQQLMPGLPAYTRTQLARAQTVDQMMSQNPLLSKQEADVLVDAELGRASHVGLPGVQEQQNLSF